MAARPMRRRLVVATVVLSAMVVTVPAIVVMSAIGSVAVIGIVPVLAVMAHLTVMAVVVVVFRRWRRFLVAGMSVGLRRPVRRAMVRLGGLVRRAWRCHRTLRCRFVAGPNAPAIVGTARTVCLRATPGCVTRRRRLHRRSGVVRRRHWRGRRRGHVPIGDGLGVERDRDGRRSGCGRRRGRQTRRGRRGGRRHHGRRRDHARAGRAGGRLARWDGARRRRLRPGRWRR